jgi:hypothetical protein
MAAFGIFGLLQIHGFLNWVRSQLSAESYRRFFNFTIIAIASVLGLGLAVATGLYEG